MNDNKSSSRNKPRSFHLILMMLFSILLVISPLMGLDVASSASVTQQTSDLFTLPVMEDLEFAIVFINYDPSLIDTTALRSYLPSNITLPLQGENLIQNLTYTFLFANSSYTQELLSYIDSIAQREAQTSRLNLTALNAQALDGHPRKLFLSQNGTAIPAEAIEEWLHQNPYHPDADYEYYVFNLSYFDSVDHSQEHWFTVREIDPDSGVQRHWWRNEWDFPINFDAKFPYAGYSGKYADYFFDPTAFQWYTQWNFIWFQYDPSLKPYLEKDLDQYLREGGDINFYIGTWLGDLMNIHPYVSAPYFGNSISIQLVIFQNVSHLGFTNAGLQWLINTTHFQEVIQELVPHATVDLNVTIVEFSRYSELETFFSSSEVKYSGPPPIDQYRYYSGSTLWNLLWDPAFADKVFSDVNSDVVVRGFAFVIDNATLAEPGMWAGGGLYTGLGGGGRMIQLMELDRLYYPDRITPRRGFSRVVIHETGHALGFPHTFAPGRTSPDFIADVMGYYPGVIKYSRIRIESFQRQAVNIFISDVINPLLNRAINFELLQKDNDTKELIVSILNDITNARNDHQYIEAWIKLHELKSLIEYYLMYGYPPPMYTTSNPSSITVSEGGNDTTINESGNVTIPTSFITGDPDLAAVFTMSFLLLSIAVTKRTRKRRMK